jgi:hypothetical protein
VVSTDLLINLSSGKQLAIAVKPSSELAKPRVREKLKIEKSFWEARGVEWRIFTEREITDGMRENLLWIQPYLNPDMTDHQELSVAEVRDLLHRLEPHPRTKTTRLCAKLDDQYGLEPGFHLSTLRQRGMVPNALAPDHHKCGARGQPRREVENKVGRKRTPARIYQKDMRALTSTSGNLNFGPGVRYEIDAMIADLYLVAESSSARNHTHDAGSWYAMLPSWKRAGSEYLFVLART